MNKDIIRMAREAGIMPIVLHHWPFELERFAQKVEAALIEQGYRKCAEGQKTTQFCGMLEQAVLAEREACAKVCESYQDPFAGNAMADAIRARGQQ
jgi:hypothetical protein